MLDDLREAKRGSHRQGPRSVGREGRETRDRHGGLRILAMLFCEQRNRAVDPGQKARSRHDRCVVSRETARRLGRRRRTRRRGPSHHCLGRPSAVQHLAQARRTADVGDSPGTCRRAPVCRWRRCRIDVGGDAWSAGPGTSRRADSTPGRSIAAADRRTLWAPERRSYRGWTYLTHWSDGSDDADGE
jgi:hypothetical protein